MSRAAFVGRDTLLIVQLSSNWIQKHLVHQVGIFLVSDVRLIVDSFQDLVHANTELVVCMHKEF